MLTAELLMHVYQYYKLRKICFKFYRRKSILMSKYNVGLKTLVQKRLSEPEFYGVFSL